MKPTVIDDNFDDNRADMKRHVAACICRFSLTKCLQTRHVAALSDTR
jgi:hypothetical protein